MNDHLAAIIEGLRDALLVFLLYAAFYGTLFGAVALIGIIARFIWPGFHV